SPQQPEPEGGGASDQNPAYQEVPTDKIAYSPTPKQISPHTEPGDTQADDAFGQKGDRKKNIHTQKHNLSRRPDASRSMSKEWPSSDNGRQQRLISADPVGREGKKRCA